MVCLALLPVKAKMTTDCLILFGYLNISLNLIGCHKSYHMMKNGAHQIDWEGPGLCDGANKKFVHFFPKSLYTLTKCATVLMI